MIRGDVEVDLGEWLQGGEPASSPLYAECGEGGEGSGACGEVGAFRCGFGSEYKF